MTQRKVAVGLALFCALAFSALAAPNAMALKGTTAFTCVKNVKPGGEGFSDEHCKSAVASSAAFRHEAIKVSPNDETTKLTVSNTETESKLSLPRLKGTVEGIEFEVEAESFHSCVSETTLANKELGGAGGQMFAGGFYCGEFSKVVVTKPAGCEVAGKTIKLNKEIWVTAVVVNAKKEEEMFVHFESPAGKTFVTFELIGTLCPLKGVKVEVTGTAKANVSTDVKNAKPDGATLKFLTAETEKTLKANGNVAKFEGTFTPRMEAEAGEELNPITLTTTAK
jgi:hypothetical protein